MKKILGKIFLIITLSVNLFAGVKASLSAPAIYKGESVNFTITAEGTDVLFPEIDEIGLYQIDGTSSSQSTTIINGNISKQIAKTYSFRPSKSLTIPPFEVKVDGKSYKTKRLKVEVLKPTASKRGSDFLVKMSVDKSSAYVGEAINLTISFKHKLNAHADKLQLGEPKLEDFWIKKVEGVEKGNDGEYIVQKLHYILFPQKDGNYTIPAIEADIAKAVQTRGRTSGIFSDPFFNDPFFDSFTTRLKWKKIFSNELELGIKPLPNNLELYGDFSIDASVDKNKVYANKPVNLTIKVKGEGNIDDIKKFNIDLNNLIVYADEPTITSNLKDKTYGGEFTQKIALIADSNFTIPTIILEYFDKKTKQTKSIKTEPIDIEVIGGKSAKNSPKPTIEVANTPDAKVSKVTTNQPTKSESSHIKYLFLLIGFILGVVLTTFFNFYKNRDEKKQKDIVKKIKRAKTDQALFDLLLPYSQKAKLIANALEKLEENIYKKATNKIDKDELMDFFEEIEEKKCKLIKN